MKCSTLPPSQLSPQTTWRWGLRCSLCVPLHKQLAISSLLRRPRQRCAPRVPLSQRCKVSTARKSIFLLKCSGEQGVTAHTKAQITATDHSCRFYSILTSPQREAYLIFRNVNTKSKQHVTLLKSTSFLKKKKRNERRPPSPQHLNCRCVPRPLLAAPTL